MYIWIYFIFILCDKPLYWYKRKEVSMKTVVILGGGVAGLELATRLGRGGKDRIVLVDRAPTHFWKPLLHSVASGTIDPATHHIDYARQALNNGFEFVCGDVLDVDRHGRKLTLRRHLPFTIAPESVLEYDQLVLSFGAVTNFFGVRGAAEHSLSLDTVEQAEAFRQRFLDRCLAAGLKGQGLDIVIVGAGPTGVELAADLRHTVDTLVRYRVSKRDFARDVRIRIVERGSRPLAGLDPAVSAAAAKRLKAIGVEICTDTAVSEVTDNAVLTADGRRFPSAITVWAAGVQGSSLATQVGLSLNRNQQILVDDRLASMDDPHVYAMGDCSSIVNSDPGVMVPPSAQAARQQAIYLARSLRQGRAAPAFSYRDYGALVSLGPFGTVGILLQAVGSRHVRVSGMIARLIYKWSYQSYVMSNQGTLRTLGQMLARWMLSKTATPINWK
jgi:NADH dehydrogenase